MFFFRSFDFLKHAISLKLWSLFSFSALILESYGSIIFFFAVRGSLAQLSYEKLDDVIGRTDLLKPRDISLLKTQHLDLLVRLHKVSKKNMELYI